MKKTGKIDMFFTNMRITLKPLFGQLKLSQNFSFWESLLRFNGKNGCKTFFPRAWHKTNRFLGQAQLSFFLIFTILCSFLLGSCDTKKEEIPVIPPVTSPLSGEFIGFGVITESFTHISADPSANSSSIGYLRRGSRVRIVRRQTIKTQDGFVSWVLTDGSQQGWLREDVMDIYNNENQAITASELLSR
jgi:hypothetical protein